MLTILQKWDILINSTLNPSGETLISLSDEVIQTLITESKSAQDKASLFLMKDIFEISKNMDKQQYVQVNHAMLIRLLNRLHSYKQTKGLSDKILNLYNIISGHLETALDFIEDFFSNYIDRNEKVPAGYLTLSIEELARQLEVLRLTFKPNNMEGILQNILVNNFNKFCSKKICGVTYNELVYQKDLMNELLDKEISTSEISIRKILFYFNFNDDDYVAYFYEKLNALLEKLSTKKEKIIALRFEQKNINQLPARLNCYFSSMMPSLKEQVNQWIEEEIKFIETEQIPETLIKTDNETDNKIHTTLSVAKLALLIKLMVIDKIITNRVVAHVLRIMIKTVTTLQKENVAFGSLETKYHNPDRGTISAVKDMLFRWINILNKL